MRMQRKLTRLALLFSPFLMTGCATGISATDSGCKSFRPISASVKDTTSTKRQVVAHNRAFDAICK